MAPPLSVQKPWGNKDDPTVAIHPGKTPRESPMDQAKRRRPTPGLGTVLFSRDDTLGNPLGTAQGHRNLYAQGSFYSGRGSSAGLLPAIFQNTPIAEITGKTIPKQRKKSLEYAEKP